MKSVSDELAALRDLEPMLDLIQRTPGNEEKAALVKRMRPAASLGDIRPDRVCTPNKLHADGPALERGPTSGEAIHIVSELGSEPVRDESPEGVGAHASERAWHNRTRPLCLCLCFCLP